MARWIKTLLSVFRRKEVSPRSDAKTLPDAFSSMPPAQSSTEHPSVDLTQESPVNATDTSPSPTSVLTGHSGHEAASSDPARDPEYAVHLEAAQPVPIAVGGQPCEASSEPAPLSTPPDLLPDRYYAATPGKKLSDGRYGTLQLIGVGQYSQVWSARDQLDGTLVALKILTSDCYGRGHDIFELEVLEAITKQQRGTTGEESFYVVSLLDHFQLHDSNGVYKCLVLPLLGGTLAYYTHGFLNKRIPVREAKQITRQLLVALDFLHERCNVIHTDLHPSNICFEVPQSELQRLALGHLPEDIRPVARSSELDVMKIIDFGVASWTNRHLSDKIQPEHLRAPEVYLGAPWGKAVDIWSLGCLVIEIVKGHIAFPGAADVDGHYSSAEDHLAQHMEVLGPMPSSLLRRGTRTHEYFDEKGVLLRIPDLEVTNLRDHMDGKEGILTRPHDMGADEVEIFVDFLRGALALDPDDRKTASELLQHEWLRCGGPSSI